MLRERCKRTGLERFEAYSFNRPTRSPVLYISYEVGIFFDSESAKRLLPRSSFDVLDDIRFTKLLVLSLEKTEGRGQDEAPRAIIHRHLHPRIGGSVVFYLG